MLCRSLVQGRLGRLFFFASPADNGRDIVPADSALVAHAPHRRGGLLMIRLAFIALAAALGTSSLAHAQQQTPIERGTYLMQSIVACGNCHTQNTPQGPRP